MQGQVILGFAITAVPAEDYYLADSSLQYVHHYSSEQLRAGPVFVFVIGPMLHARHCALCHHSIVTI